jgi:valyl-tRNA synthetase
MSAATRKPPSAGPNRLPDSTNTSSASPARQARASTPTSTTTSALNGTPARTRSIRTVTPVSARAGPRGTSSLSVSSTDVEDAQRAETVALVDDLKARLEKSDAASEHYRKQTEILQSRFDEALQEQVKLEERVHESEEQIEVLRNEKREAAREIREMETIYEAEKSSILKEKEEMSNREEEMQTVINRLKDTINQRNADDEFRPTRQCRFPKQCPPLHILTNTSNSE